MEPNENVGYRFSKNRTELGSKFKNSVSAVRFSKKLTLAVMTRFSRCLVHNSSCSTIRSTVNVFFFMPYLCTSSSESLRLTISWTNSAGKYVISSVIPLRRKRKMVSTDECNSKYAVRNSKPKKKQNHS